MDQPLSALDILRITTVLEDCADQLAILGHIMTNPDEHRPPNKDMTADKTVKRQETIRQILPLNVTETRLIKGGKQELQWAYRKQMTVEHSDLSPDNLEKVQRDREFLAGMISDLMAELKESGTFQKLLHTVEEEKRRKTQHLDIILKEKETKDKIQTLQSKLLDIHKKKAVELQKLNESIAYLKDQVQEKKVQTALERSYMTKTSELLVYQGQKHNTDMEKQLEDEIKLLHDKIEEEERLHAKTNQFLMRHHADLVHKLETWMEQYERDTEEKQQELNTLKTNRANNLSHLQELAKKYRESEQVVMEDRMQKEQQRQQLERERMVWNAAIKVQSWWRGTMVRRGMDPQKKGKKPKESKKKKKKK